MGKAILYNTGLFYNTPGVVYNGVLPDGPNLQTKKTMSMTTTEVFGFADAMNQAMTSNQTDLQANGLTVTQWITQGATLKTDAVTKNDEQEAAKAALKTKTATTDAALQALYDFYSTKLDAMAGVLGKNSNKAKSLLRLRSDIRRGSNASKTPATTKTP